MGHGPRRRRARDRTAPGRGAPGDAPGALAPNEAARSPRTAAVVAQAPGVVHFQLRKCERRGISRRSAARQAARKCRSAADPVSARAGQVARQPSGGQRVARAGAGGPAGNQLQRSAVSARGRSPRVIKASTSSDRQSRGPIRSSSLAARCSPISPALRTVSSAWPRAVARLDAGGDGGRADCGRAEALRRVVRGFGVCGRGSPSLRERRARVAAFALASPDVGHTVLSDRGPRPPARRAPNGIVPRALEVLGGSEATPGTGRWCEPHRARAQTIGGPSGQVGDHRLQVAARDPGQPARRSQDQFFGQRHITGLARERVQQHQAFVCPPVDGHDHRPEREHALSQ